MGMKDWRRVATISITGTARDRKLARGMQQEHGIRAARDGHAHALPGYEHAISRDEFGYAVQHSSA
jgi:hypothetical protein